MLNCRKLLIGKVTWAGCSRRPPPCSLPLAPAWRWRRSCRCRRRRRPRRRWLAAERWQESISTDTTTHSVTRRRVPSSTSPQSWSCPDTSWRTFPRPWWWCGGSWGTGRGGRAWPGSGWSAAGRSRRSRCTAGSCYWRCAGPSPPPGAADGGANVRMQHFTSIVFNQWIGEKLVNDQWNHDEQLWNQQMLVSIFFFLISVVRKTTLT